MILGVAGHVDHGKTSLVKALTGVDTDRLPEEKRRGMTIDLGFAHFDVRGERIGIVDVPGHERFIKTMAAGVGGIDAVLLVVAADEGVMPQTREHVAICALLGVQRGIIVVSKADLAARAGLDQEVAALVSGTFLQTADVVHVSARNGQGLEHLRQCIADLPTAKRDPEGPLFMPVDRVFTLKGHGSVVAGSVLSGTISVGDEVWVMPMAFGARLRGLQSHGVEVLQAAAGQRVALNLANVELNDLHRGCVVTRAGEVLQTTRVDVELRLINKHSLVRRSRQRVVLGTLQLEAVVELIGRDEHAAGEGPCFAQLRFTSPVAAVAGQRFVLRDTETTTGGGRVLRVDARRTRGRDGSELQALASGEPHTRLLWALDDAGRDGATEAQLFARLAISRAVLRQLLAKVPAVHVGDAWLSRSVVDALAARATSKLSDTESMPRESLREQLGVSDALLELVERDPRFERNGARLALAGRTSAVDERARVSSHRVLALYSSGGLAPPARELLADRLGLAAKEFDAVEARLLREGRLVRAGAFVFEAEAVKALERRVREYFAKHATMTTQAFKELTGQSRKFAMPLAEHFDARGVTLRVGDVRKLR